MPILSRREYARTGEEGFDTTDTETIEGIKRPLLDGYVLFVLLHPSRSRLLSSHLILLYLDQTYHLVSVTRMRSSTAASISAVAIASFFQLCPAPPVVIAAAITASGAVIGGAISTAGKMKRQEGLPPGVPQQDYDRCVEELRTANVVVTGPVSNNGKLQLPQEG